MRVLAISLITAFVLSMTGTAQADQSFDGPRDSEETGIMEPMAPVPDNEIFLDDNMPGDWLDSERSPSISGYFEQPMEPPFAEVDEQYDIKQELPTDRCHGTVCET